MIRPSSISIRLIKEWKMLSPYQKTKCFEMTLYDGYMRNWVNVVNPIIIKAYANGHGFNGKCVGWAAMDRADCSVMLYVKRPFRGIGVGKKLIESVLSITKPMGLTAVVYPWDAKSEEFFGRFLHNNAPIKYGNVSSLEEILLS